jgi:hypothetical protein
MNNHCWYELNLSVSDAVRSDFDLSTTGFRTFRNPRVVFTDQWIVQLMKLGLSIRRTTVFYKSVDSHSPYAHIDGDQFPDHHRPEYSSFAINWVLSGEHSEMIWYDMPDNPDTDIVQTPGDTPYRWWHHENLTAIDCHRIADRPVILRIDTPHRIRIEQEPRIAVSIRTNSHNNDWLTVINDLRSKNILVER